MRPVSIERACEVIIERSRMRGTNSARVAMYPANQIATGTASQRSAAASTMSALVP